MTDINLNNNLSLSPKLNECISLIGIMFPGTAAKITERRIESMHTILKAAQNKLNSLSLSPEEYKDISLKCQIPIIEYASLEEDVSLQELWANLITNILNPYFKNDIRLTFINILRELAPIDALLLNALYSSNTPYKFLSETECLIWSPNDYILVNRDSFNVSLEVLISLNLLTQLNESNSVSIANYYIVTKDTTHLTTLGKLFAFACIRNAGQAT